MPMKKPPHPGRIIRDEVLSALSLDVTSASRLLGVARSTLSKLLNEKASLSAEMALRIEKAFGPKADHLMRIQVGYDMAQVRMREGEIQVERYQAANDAS